MALTDLVFTSTEGGSPALVFGGEATAPTRDTDLVFSQPQPSHPTELVFGGEATGTHPDVTATLAATLPALQGAAAVVLGVPATMAGVLPGLSGALAITHDNQTQRPTVGRVQAVAQIAAPAESGLTQPEQHARPTNTGVRHRDVDALGAIMGNTPTFATAQPVSPRTAGRFQDGTTTQAHLHGQWQDGNTEQRVHLQGKFQEGTAARCSKTVRLQDGLRDRRTSRTTRWQDASKRRKAYTGRAGAAKAQPLYRRGRFQEAWPPRSGISPVPVVPVVPPPYWGTVLVFACPPLSAPNLVFGTTQCSPVGLVVIPIRRTYMVTNSATLTRVEGGIPISVYGMTLALDMDSWTWSFSATCPLSQLSNLEPSTSGGFVEVVAMINGVAYNALVESVSTSRTFGQSSLSVSGRGVLAVLDSPYSPILSFGNVTSRTAVQLIADVLTDNGAPLGWTTTFALDDWLVPAGVFSHQGTRISALKAIAGAAGGYIQPHPSLREFSVLAMYPSTPWGWDSLVIPDYVLPSDVTIQEGVSWLERPRYTRVFVSGQQQGVLGQVTVTGEAGDLVAPMVVDPLITTAGAARQRGISVLGATGRAKEITLTLPVLPETGIIPPGKFVRYVDGMMQKTGIVRSTNISVGLPSIAQTLVVESYVN